MHGRLYGHRLEVANSASVRVGLVLNRFAYETPAFDSSDPVVCHELRLRPSLWAVVFNTLELLGNSYSWKQEDETHATVQEVIAEIRTATDAAIFSECIMIGEVRYITTAVPDWCLICDGATYLKADYPDLWTVIDAAYEIDTDHFRVPDLIARFPLGSGVLAVQGGEDQHTLTVAEIPSHRHSQDQFSTAASTVLGELPGLAIAPAAGFTGFTGGGDPHNNMPPYETMLPVIVARHP